MILKKKSQLKKTELTELTSQTCNPDHETETIQ